MTMEGSLQALHALLQILSHSLSESSRVFDVISFRENFAKLATKRFSCFAKMRDEFRNTADITKETSFAKHENRENKENLK